MFAHPDIDDIGVGRGDGDGSDGRGFDEAIGDVAPVFAGVDRLVDAASGRAEVIGQGVIGDAGNGDSAASAKGANIAPFHGGQHSLGLRAGGENEQREGLHLIPIVYFYLKRRSGVNARRRASCSQRPSQTSTPTMMAGKNMG